MLRQEATRLALVLPVLILSSATVPESTPDAPATVEEVSCSFAIRAQNNMSFDVWVDLYSSRLDNGGFGVFGGYKPLKIQNHRLSPGKSMDRRYTASGTCGKERKWEFAVRIGRADGKKIYKYLYKTTRGSGDRTIDLGKSSTWGL